MNFVAYHQLGVWDTFTDDWCPTRYAVEHAFTYGKDEDATYFWNYEHKVPFGRNESFWIVR